MADFEAAVKAEEALRGLELVREQANRIVSQLTGRNEAAVVAKALEFATRALAEAEGIAVKDEILKHRAKPKAHVPPGHPEVVRVED